MKFIVSPSLIVALLAMAFCLKAQDTLKEGKLNITLTFPPVPGDLYPSLTASMKVEEVVYIKNGKSYMKMKTKSGSIATITNGRKGETNILTEQYGQKYAMKEEVNTALKQPEVKLTNEVVTLLGFHCKKAILTYNLGNNEKKSFDCLYTKEITANTSNTSGLDLPGIDGFLVEITILNHGQLITSTITSVERIPVPDSLFEISSDYPFKTKEEVEQGLKSSSNNSSVFLPGTVVPDIKLKDVNRHVLKLSSLRGKYVLVDFWAAGCVPCRAENPNVVKVYNKYKDRGFTIYSVSLDSDKSDWQQAIKYDQLAWPNHVCDFKGWQSPVCLQYKITGIPSNYLIDKDGKVIAIDLRGDELESELSEIFK